MKLASVMKYMCISYAAKLLNYMKNLLFYG